MQNNYEQLYHQLNIENKELKTKIEVCEKNSEITSYLYSIFDNYVITSQTDTKGIITAVSKPFEELSGFSAKELIGKPHNIIRHPDMPSEAFKDLWNTIQNKKVWRGEVKNMKKNGDYYWVDSTVIPLIDANNEIFGYKAIRVDITKSKYTQEKLNFFSNTDEINIDFSNLE